MIPPPRLNQLVDNTQNNVNHNNLHPRNLNISVLQTSPSTRRRNYEFVDDLEEGIVSNSDQRERNTFCKINPSPHLFLQIKHLTAWALLDTGSQITAMSESFYEKLKEKYKLNVLPVSNIFVSTAIGQKNTTIKKHILVDFQIDEFTSSFVFVVIPHLSCDIILGNDWNLKNGTVIDYKNTTIQLKGKIVALKSVMFEPRTSDKILLSQNEDKIFIYLCKAADLTKLINSKEKTNKILKSRGVTRKLYTNNFSYINSMYCENNNNVYNNTDFDEYVEEKIFNNNTVVSIKSLAINELNRADNDLVDVSKDNNITNLSEELSSYACKLTLLDLGQRQRFTTVLLNNQTLFSDKPGCARGYNHIIKITTKNPVIRKSYPVPLALRDKVRIKLQQMIEDKIIERSISPHCNPLRIVHKK